MAVARAAANEQLAIVGLKTQAEAQAEEAAEAKRREQRGVLKQRLMAAIRDYARLRQQIICANELDKEDSVYGGGKGVSSAVLRSCLEATPGNYFRLDWIFWFAEECEEVADVLLEVAGRGKPQKSPEEELADLKEIVRAEYPRQADKLIRKAAAPKR
jgi:hypothetical protein